MKSSLTALFLVLMISAFGQDRTDAYARKEKSFNTDKSMGIFEFQLKPAPKAEFVQKRASYYTDFFTVDYKEEKGKMKIRLTENTEQNKLIILRLFRSLGIENIHQDNLHLNSKQFYEQKIKN
ncbi:MAG: hypothetical protein EP338_04525 [Bacteroidetes bacterium]|nr:MAG: hypothetical protein EP338_04525 [Bacteroidota bacterium]